MLGKYVNPKRFCILVGVVLLGGLLSQAHRAFLSSNEETSSVVVLAPVKLSRNTAIASPMPAIPRLEETLEERASRDPVGFIESCLDRYDRTVRDYECTFSKQELIAGKLSAEQVMRAFFREKPFSVRLEWIKNEDKCSRVLYVADRWVEEGRQMAVVEPGAIARLFIPYVMMEIDGREAQKSSRRTINQFGLRNSLALILKYCKLSQEKGLLDFEYMGKGEVDGRQTLVFERTLPYTENDDTWPDRVLVVHIDAEHLFPALCVAYADDGKKDLLGKYMTTDVKLNVNLPDATFTKEGMGL